VTVDLDDVRLKFAGAYLRKAKVDHVMIITIKGDNLQGYMYSEVMPDLELVRRILNRAAVKILNPDSLEERSIE